jgi:CubicO group peptidase (beta-lactamase class C family)
VARVINRLTELAARSIRVPKDLGSITDIGSESGSVDVECLWQRIEEFYAAGMHPGIQVCIRYRGDVVLDRAIGYRSGVKPGKDPAPTAQQMLVDTPLNLFSGAKAITSIMMHKLEAEGVVDLDAPVAAYLPGFERNGKGSITLAQVLNHRAGIPSLPADAFDLDLLSDPEEIENILINMTPTHPIGGAPHYHAVTGGFVMSAVVRRQTGAGLKEYIAREVKQPLGLRWFDYGVSPSDVDQVAENIVTGFPLGPLLSRVMRRLLGVPWDKVVEMSNDPRFITGEIPSANLIASARDTATFYQCVLNGGVYNDKKIFEPDTVEKLTHAPDAKLRLDRMIGMPMRYGNGFMMGSNTISLYGWNHPRAYGHLGMSNSFTWVNPDRELVVALLSTGKPIMGTHLSALPKVLTEIHNTFPLSHRKKARKNK